MQEQEAASYFKLNEKYKKLRDKFSEKSDEILNLEMKLCGALAENVINRYIFTFRKILFLGWTQKESGSKIKIIFNITN